MPFRSRRQRSRSPSPSIPYGRRNYSPPDRRDRRKRGEQSPKRDQEEDKIISDEERKTCLLVESIDYCMAENTTSHHTDRFECTDMENKDFKLVLRRGQPFRLKIEFNRPYKKDIDDLKFSFRIGGNPRKKDGTLNTFMMEEYDDNKISGNFKEWYARIDKEDGNCMWVQLVTPADCIIGQWEFNIMTKTKGNRTEREKKFMSPNDIIILFNAWCEDDLVYFPETDYLKEYILNDSGVIGRGNYTKIDPKVWTFAQFETNILEICLFMLRQHFGKIDRRMNNPVTVSRAISKCVTSSNKNGVLWGRWSGDYSDGKSPTFWSSSQAILEQWYETGSPVKYGQCWVFSGLTTTVCRALGIAARSVTNYNSAHDCDGSIAIDKEEKYNEKTKEYESCGSDSIWNFHVWNDVFLCRKEKGKGWFCWNALDGTPQELSDGDYCCGPAPIPAIKRGDLGNTLYDLPFIAAEVNADVLKWRQNKDTKEWKLIKRDTTRVGKKLLTKKPTGKPYKKKNKGFFSFFSSLFDSDDDEGLDDIIEQYKFKEGSLEDKLASQNAQQYAIQKHNIEVCKEEAVDVEIFDDDKTLWGQSYNVKIKVTNKTNTPKTIKGYVTFKNESYDGHVDDGVIKREKLKERKLGGKDGYTYECNIEPEEYEDRLCHPYQLRADCFVIVDNNDDEPVTENETCRLRRNDVEIEAPGQVNPNESFKIKIKYENPLYRGNKPKTLKDCVVRVEGPKITDIEENIGDIEKELSHTMTLKTGKKCGDATINVTLETPKDKLKDMCGSFNIHIGP